jgi:beta-hydroxylase
VLNRVFEYAYKIRILGTRIKAWNRPAYYLLKWLADRRGAVRNLG